MTMACRCSSIYGLSLTKIQLRWILWCLKLLSEYNVGLHTKVHTHFVLELRHHIAHTSWNQDFLYCCSRHLLTSSVGFCPAFFFTSFKLSIFPVWTQIFRTLEGRWLNIPASLVRLNFGTNTCTFLRSHYHAVQHSNAMRGHLSSYINPVTTIYTKQTLARIFLFSKWLYYDTRSIAMTQRCTIRKETIRRYLSSTLECISYNMLCNFVITLIPCILLRYTLTHFMFSLSYK
jgi:hypothetical protein